MYDGGGDMYDDGGLGVLFAVKHIPVAGKVNQVRTAAAMCMTRSGLMTLDLVCKFLI
jgi:hypothetical protein